jgi:hypothetical protein
VGANTYNTALAIGEKAAIIIAEDLGIKIPGIVAYHQPQLTTPTTPLSLLAKRKPLL